MCWVPSPWHSLDRKTVLNLQHSHSWHCSCFQLNFTVAHWFFCLCENTHDLATKSNRYLNSFDSINSLWFKCHSKHFRQWLSSFLSQINTDDVKTLQGRKNERLDFCMRGREDWQNDSSTHCFFLINPWIWQVVYYAIPHLLYQSYSTCSELSSDYSPVMFSTPHRDSPVQWEQCN